MEELQIKEFFQYYYKEKKINIILFIATIIIVMFYSFFMKEPLYKTTMNILINKENISIVEYMKNDDILEQLSEEFNIEKDVINNSLNAQFDKERKIIEISYIGEDANKIYDVIIRYKDILKEKLEQNFSVTQYDIINKPQIPNSHFNINHAKDIIISIIGGIIITLFYNLIKISFSGIISTNTLKEKNIKINFMITKKTYKQQIKYLIETIELNHDIEKKNILILGIDEKKSNNRKLILNMAQEYKKANKNVLIINSNVNAKSKYNNKIETENNLLLKSKTISEQEIEKLIDNIEENISILEITDKGIEITLKTIDQLRTILDILNQKYDIILIDNNSINYNTLTLFWIKISKIRVLNIKYDNVSIPQLLDVAQITENINEEIDLGVIDCDF